MKGRSLLLAAGLSLAVFAVLALAARAGTFAMDELQIALWVNNLQVGSAVNSLLVWASLYGREGFWILLVAAMFLFGDRRTKLVAVGLCGVFVGGIVAGELAKVIVARPRPDVVLPLVLGVQGSPIPIVRIPLSTDYSFPSGHALIVWVGAVYALLTFRRKWFAILVAIEAAVVSFSRVYTFEHYPTDVIGGLALGAFVAFAGLYVGRKYLSRTADRTAAYLVKLFREGRLQL